MSKDNDGRTFSFIAGQNDRASEDGESLDDTPLSLALEAVAILLDWRKRSAFRCLANVRHANQTGSYEVVARPRDLSYQVKNNQTGRIESFDPQTRILREGSTERPADVNQMATEPIATRLAFPLSLGIWGRPGDSYRIIGAARRENALIVSLTHQDDASLTGELSIDVGRRTAIRLDTPTLGIEYEEIQPDQ